MSELSFESAGGYWNQPVRVLRAAIPREGIDQNRYVGQVLLDPNFDPEGAFLALGPSPFGYIGYCLAIAPTTPIENVPPDLEKGYITLLGVMPKSRGLGAGSQLLENAEQFLRSRGRKEVLISPYAPGYFTPGVDVSAYETGVGFLEKRGYEVISRPLAMERSLWDYEMPDEIESLVKSQRPAIAYDPRRLVGSRAYELIQFVSNTFSADWARIIRQALREMLEGGRQDRIGVAAHYPSGDIVGFSHHRGERFGPIGVHPNFRGQGIGQALMHTTLRAQQSAGHRTSWFLWTDDETANHFYTPAGFREIRRFAVMRKGLG